MKFIKRLHNKRRGVIARNENPSVKTYRFCHLLLQGRLMTKQSQTIKKRLPQPFSRLRNDTSIQQDVNCCHCEPQVKQSQSGTPRVVPYAGKYTQMIKFTYQTNRFKTQKIVKKQTTSFFTISLICTSIFNRNLCYFEITCCLIFNFFLLKHRRRQPYFR